MLVGENPFLSIKLEHLVIEVLINGNRPNFHENVPEHIKDLIERCWAQDPNDRPSFDDIVNELKNDPIYITESVNESDYRNYIEFLDNYDGSFDICKKYVSFEDFIKGKQENVF